jgi:succinate dehydrogenase / fumarate reductase, cytochrome b subunit
MRSFGQLWASTIFQKWMMAVTGILLVLFLVGHLSGNLLIFLGPDDMNAYGVELRELLHGSFIWVTRLGLLLCFVLHIYSGITLSARNRRAKGGANARFEPQRSTVASRSMIYSGLLLLFYLIYHLAHFTWGMAHSQYYHYVDALGRHDVYRMVVESFQDPMISIAYIAAMVVTALHLNHAIQSAFQTLGVAHPRYTPLIRAGGRGLSLALAVGFSAVPIAVLTGLVR